MIETSAPVASSKADVPTCEAGLGLTPGPVVITASGVARQFLHPRTHLASVIEHTRRISVFDRDEHLVCEVWVKNPESEASRKLARKRADKIRNMLDKE